MVHRGGRLRRLLTFSPLCLHPVYVIIVIFCLASASALFSCLDALLDLVGCGTVRYDAGPTSCSAGLTAAFSLCLLAGPSGAGGSPCALCCWRPCASVWLWSGGSTGTRTGSFGQNIAVVPQRSQTAPTALVSMVTACICSVLSVLGPGSSRDLFQAGLSWRTWRIRQAFTAESGPVTILLLLLCLC